jgi:hypothetical protein
MLETAKDSCCSILYSLGFLVELVVRCQTKHLTENNSASTKACPTQPCDRARYRVVWCRGDHNLPSQTWVTTVARDGQTRMTNHEAR